jgi:hypothetical protein
MTVRIRKQGTILQFFSDLQEFDLSNIDAFDYDRFNSVLKVFNNGIEVQKLENIDSELWKEVLRELGSDFRRYQWASFKENCITNQSAFNDELKVTFTDKTFVRS